MELKQRVAERETGKLLKTRHMFFPLKNTFKMFCKCSAFDDENPLYNFEQDVRESYFGDSGK